MTLAAPCGALRSKNSDSPSNFPPQPCLFGSSKCLYMRYQINSRDSRAEKKILISAKESQRSITPTLMSFIVKFLSNVQGIKVWKFERYHTTHSNIESTQSKNSYSKSDFQCKNMPSRYVERHLFQVSWIVTSLLFSTFLVPWTRNETPSATNIPLPMRIDIQMLLENMLSYPNGHKNWTIKVKITQN